ncbi:MAG: cytochrome c oxidase accessory protein CcoG [Proteobacteria bacterium]|nr:cytochrome c oxidase accessory protein CcoG [Pseudomonadota bacterium]
MDHTRKVIPLIPVAALPGVQAASRVQARSVRGRFTQWRWAFVWLTQLVFYGLPWLNWNGRQAVLFDLASQRFDLFGQVLFPQDLIYLTGLLVFSALLLFFATTVAGRVWCGFACPQTVYTQLFMWIEHRFEGDRMARQRLDAAPWGLEKLRRRGGKNLAWLALCLVTGFSLVGWFTPVRELAASALALRLGPWELFWVLFYGGLTYLMAGVLRERMCQHACPYGRFQGSMLDAATLIVAYDVPRGEPRGARARGSDARAQGQGDCVDCTLCVQVCPVGIDIRQGLQAACISCGLCIDACNGVMDKLRAPRGLIRFAPLQAAGAATWRRALLRPRVLAYGAALAVLAVAMGWAWAERPELRVNALRDRAVLSRLAEDGSVENVYRLQLMNASLQPRQLTVAAQGVGELAGVPLRVAPGAALAVAAAEDRTAVVTVRMPADDALRLAERRTLPIRFLVRDGSGPGAAVAQTDSTFLLR